MNKKYAFLFYFLGLDIQDKNFCGKMSLQHYILFIYVFSFCMRLLWIGLGLILFGILAIYSVSIHESFTLTLKLVDSGKWFGDPVNSFYFFRQLKNIAVALVAGLFVYMIPTTFFQKDRNVIILFIGFFVLQLLVFIPGIGITLNGARGWINIPLFPTLQPAEFFKIGYVLFLSSWLIRKRNMINTSKFFLSFIILNAFFFLVFLMIPDLGTLLILGFVGLILCRYAGAKIKYILMIFFGGIAAGLLAGSVAGMVSDRFQYIQKRFTYFLSSEVDPQNRQVGWQNQQALIAVGGGGLLGKGYGKGLQKFGYIPEAQSDFIFSAFAEEIGFVGALFLLFLYFGLAWYVVPRLPTLRSDYHKMMAVGILSLILIQVFVNIGVNLKIMPNTGLTLPFVSYGGTAIMVNIIEILFLYKLFKERGKLS